MKYTKQINCEPHWPALFELATQIVKSKIPEDEGQELVVEMLQFGKRLELLCGREIHPITGNKAEESITKYDAAIAAKLDELNSREEFEAKPSLLEETVAVKNETGGWDSVPTGDNGEPTSALVARIFKDDDGDRRWEDLDLMNEKGTRVWSTGITPATGGAVGAEERATDYAHSVHAEIDWKSITH